MNASRGIIRKARLRFLPALQSGRTDRSTAAPNAAKIVVRLKENLANEKKS
jgi:hypothetical protein